MFARSLCAALDGNKHGLRWSSVAFTISEFTRVRPFAFHLTDRANLQPLVHRSILEPATDLLARAGRASAVQSRRADLMPIWVDGQRVILKDHKPLVFANAELAPGWAPGDFVEFLNRHVFFWPGNERGPVKYRERLFSAYEADTPAVLRTPTADLIAENRGLTPLFCPFNSGAPRMQSGQRVPRGPDLFAPAGEFPRRASRAVELVFRGAVVLPESTQFRVAGRDWDTLSSAAI